MNELKPGDVASLKNTKQPPMTVECVEGDRVRVVWFDIENNLRRDDFDISILEFHQS